jgi:hypothetical protein
MFWSVKRGRSDENKLWKLWRWKQSPGTAAGLERLDSKRAWIMYGGRYVEAWSQMRCLQVGEFGRGCVENSPAFTLILHACNPAANCSELQQVAALECYDASLAFRIILSPVHFHLASKWRHFHSQRCAGLSPSPCHCRPWFAPQI